MSPSEAIEEAREALKVFADLSVYWRERKVPNHMEAEIRYDDDETFPPTLLIDAFYSASRALAALSEGAVSGLTEEERAEAATWEGVRAAFEYRHGKGTCPDDRLEDLKVANKVGAWESELVSARAALQALKGQTP